MTLKANLAACVLFLLGILGIIGIVGGLREASAGDLVWPLAFASPVLIWSGGAWILKGHRRASLVWLAASSVLMAVGLLGVVIDVDTARQEKLTGQETMHFAAFVAMLLQWCVAVAILAVVGAVYLFGRRPLPSRPR